MPVEERQIRTGLLGFADALEARAAAETAAAPGPELHLLTFALDREEFGIPVTQVREVIRVSEITRVPQAPAHVRGVANLRGRILAVVELRSRLGLPPAELDAPLPRGGGGGARAGARPPGGRGLAGDQGARGRAWSPRRRKSSPPTSTTSPGVARWQSRLIILLDLEKALLPTE